MFNIDKITKDRKNKVATFDEFYQSLDPDSGIRGKQFERFVKWFLKTDPEWQSQVEEVWLWEVFRKTPEYLYNS